MFNDIDLALFESKGITPTHVLSQLQQFSQGFPFLEIAESASIDSGILKFNIEEQTNLLNAWDDYLKEGHRVLKFVPASGAASRMFKDLFEFIASPSPVPSTPFVKAFFRDIQHFAFFGALNEACIKNENKDVKSLMESGSFKVVVENLLHSKGLNYGELPKGLLCFHAYPTENRKAVTEHLVEGVLYANANGLVQVHFTVSPEHKALFMEEVHLVAKTIEQNYGVKLSIDFSVQKSSTDTVAADKDNQPFRSNGEILFRPGGHGALIENLNDLDGAIVFVKNIDNVVPDRLKSNTVRYKKILAGHLVTIQRQVFDYLNILESGQYNRDLLLEIIRFLRKTLFTRNPEVKLLEDSELALYLIAKLNRPIRVCGMVLNEGEPGGGPFWAWNSDGTVSLQILESSQLDLSNPKIKSLFERGTHFNPVDLVCSLKNYKGEKFNLTNFVDPNTGFISFKSKDGKDLKALELPGLWNGAMSDWNTIFVEVPIETFNPVKTVNDLLRPQHQENQDSVI